MTATEKNMWISRGSGNGETAYTVGQAVLIAGEWAIVTTAREQFVREDGRSLGVGDDSGYLYHADCRPATDAEVADAQAAQDARFAAKSATIAARTATMAAAGKLECDRQNCIATVQQSSDPITGYAPPADAERIIIEWRANDEREYWVVTRTHIAYVESSYKTIQAWVVAWHAALAAEIRNLWPRH